MIEQNKKERMKIIGEWRCFASHDYWVRFCCCVYFCFWGSHFDSCFAAYIRLFGSKKKKFTIMLPRRSRSRAAFNLGRGSSCINLIARPRGDVRNWKDGSGRVQLEMVVRNRCSEFHLRVLIHDLIPWLEIMREIVNQLRLYMPFSMASLKTFISELIHVFKKFSELSKWR